MGSNPIIGTFENAILRGGIDLILQIVCCERSRTKTHRITVDLPSIRQVIGPGYGSGRAAGSILFLVRGVAQQMWSPCSLWIPRLFGSVCLAVRMTLQLRQA